MRSANKHWKLSPAGFASCRRVIHSWRVTIVKGQTRNQQAGLGSCLCGRWMVLFPNNCVLCLSLLTWFLSYHYVSFVICLPLFLGLAAARVLQGIFVQEPHLLAGSYCNAGWLQMICLAKLKMAGWCSPFFFLEHWCRDLFLCIYAGFAISSQFSRMLMKLYSLLFLSPWVKRNG